MVAVGAHSLDKSGGLRMTDRGAKLEQLHEMLDDEDADLHPEDLVDEWDTWAPNYEYDHVTEGQERMVPVDKIVGTDPINEDRLVERRLVKIVNTLVAGEWEPRYDPVKLARHPNGDYYVTSDGNHRVLAHKFLGYDEIYATVTTYVDS